MKTSKAEPTFGSYIRSLGTTLVNHPFAKKVAANTNEAKETIITETKKLGCRFDAAYKAFKNNPVTPTK